MRRIRRRGKKRPQITCACGNRLALPRSFATNAVMKWFDAFMVHISHGGFVVSDKVVTIEVKLPKRKPPTKQVEAARRDILQTMEKLNKPIRKATKVKPTKVEVIDAEFEPNAEDLLAYAARFPPEVITEAAKKWLAEHQ